MEIKEFECGNWKIRYLPKEYLIPPKLVQKGKELIGKWVDLFPKEKTWVQKHIGIPSLLVRLDCVIHNGKLETYEIEERPAGIGISWSINPVFVERFKMVRSQWPDFKVVISSQRKWNDDYLWKECWNGISPDLVLVRAEPDEKEFHGLESFSVSSLKRKGDKSYGIEMGLWHPIDQLPWEEGFSLKPFQGSKLKGIEIWDPEKRKGYSTKTRIQRVLEENNFQMYYQPFIPPMETGIEKYNWMVYRIFFGYQIEKKQWEYLGGFWNARSNLRIHATPDAIFGPVV